MKDVCKTAVATADGSVAGMLWLPSELRPTAALLVCVHGGGCNGRYFDLKGASLAMAATKRGMPLLLIDRPGHGLSTSPVNVGSPIERGAAAVHALVNAVKKGRSDVASLPVAMIGHSIGGAVALTYASDYKCEALVALCVSGIGDRPHMNVVSIAQIAATEPGAEPPANWFFGPEGSYGWKGVASLRAAAEPWRANEIEEVICAWPQRWSQIAAAITCPLHFRLAEFERIWEATPEAMRRIAATFTATEVDAAILPDGGHLYEAHQRGAELVIAQLDFIQKQSGSR